jgi:Tol biopolymer transport system component
LANQWDYKSEEIFKDGILSGRYKKFSILEGKDAVIAGASIWKYVSESYGKEVIPNLVYLAQVSRNVESGFTFVIGSGLKVLMADWYNYYYTKYSQEVQSKPPILATNQKVFGKTKKNIVYSQFKISPDGKYAVYATNQLGQIKLFLCDLETKKRKRILKKDKKLDRYTDYSVPLIAWHPSSKIFAFVYEEKGDVVLNFYDFESKKIDKRPPIYTFEKILDISYAPDGKKILMSAVQKGQSDIFLYNLISNTPEQITKDVFDDLNPRFIKGGKEIIFSSNRFNDSIKFDDKKTEGFYENNFDLFVYDYSKKSKLLRRATNTPNYNEWQAQPIDTNHLVYFTDQNNSTNRFVAKFEKL